MIKEGNVTLGGEHAIEYIHRCPTIILYTCKLYHVVNQRYPSKFNFFKKPTEAIQKAGMKL